MSGIADTRAITPKYSVVIPLHNEESSIRELYTRLNDVMTGRFEPVEFIFVDDHSTDRTPEILSELASLDRRVTALRLKRNYGQTTALAAGFDNAAGEIILSMDGDLQHDPADIPKMLEVFESTDADIVSGWREKRVDNFLLRRFPSRVANWMMAKFSGVDIHDFGTTFKVYRRETIKDIRLYGELHRFIPALAAWNGAKVVEVPIRNIVRPGGQSHYGLSRTVRVFFDLLTIRFLLRYMTRPLHFFGTFGALGMLTGTGLAIWLLVLKLLTGQHVMEMHGPIFVIAGILILAGIQMMGIGLLGELQVRHFYTASHRAPYAVDRILRLRSEESLLQ